jgi:hypothetical protein
MVTPLNGSPRQNGLLRVFWRGLVVVVLTVKVKSSLELICLAIHKHPTIDAFDFSLQVKCERREEFN